MFKLSAALLVATVYATETLIFEDNFDTLNFKTWQHELTLSGGGNWEFEEYINNRTNSFVDDGVLYLQPSLQSEAIGLDNLYGGERAIWGGSPSDLCTSNAEWGCARTGTPSNIINPIRSARLRSVKGFNFKYGRVEIRAQLPLGDWIWPAIWMLPTDGEYGTWPASGEIDIVESYGNSKETCGVVNSNMFGSTLHFGPSWDMDPYETAHAMYENDEPLSSDFHTYGMIWTEESIITYIDSEDNVVLNQKFDESMWSQGGFPDSIDNPWRFETDMNAPFNKEFYLIFNVAVGGVNNYFPDGECDKPWNNDSQTSAADFWGNMESWYPSWNYPESNDAAMKIDSVKVWSIDASSKKSTLE